jgi:hypothetical protein
LAYLITTGADNFCPSTAPCPQFRRRPRPSLTESKDYPFVTAESWDVFIQGLAYPDTPSSEQYQPNSIKANARFATFLDLMNKHARSSISMPNIRNCGRSQRIYNE